MKRLLAYPLLALMVGCAGAVLPTVSPDTRRAEITVHLESAAPIGVVAPSVARHEPGSTSRAKSPPETAPTEAAPTWSWIFERYLAVGTEGSCGRSSACHAPDMTQASSAYDWLERRGYIAGTQSPIASAANSCLRWFGGNMPPRGKPNAQAAQDVSAWVAAGALND